MVRTKKIIKVNDMSCVSCENAIERCLMELEGIVKVNASYRNDEVWVEFDATRMNEGIIEQAIGVAGYHVEHMENASDVTQNHRSSKSKQVDTITKKGLGKHHREKRDSLDYVQLLCIVILIFSIMNIMNTFGVSNLFSSFPTATKDMGYLALFIVGLLTSVHCVAMCGGINITQCTNLRYTFGDSTSSKLMPSFLYNFGRIISYTVVGFLVGAIGSVVQFSGMMSGFVAIAAGVFMIIMGVNMLNIFPWLKKFNPRLPKALGKIDKSGKTPFAIGLLNGLMPCGPLQAMQLYALSTGSPMKGALAMLCFSLGTLPLMFGLGVISSYLTKSFSRKMMMVSGILVAILGIGMLNTGLSLSGFSTSLVPTSGGTIVQIEENTEGKVQTVYVNVSSRGYEPITVKKDIPVNLVFQAENGELNGCNYAITIPKYNINQELDYGDTVVTFTPRETGIFPYSCYMGMIRSSITVVD